MPEGDAFDALGSKLGLPFAQSHMQRHIRWLGQFLVLNLPILYASE